jgi:hypothetical protein
VAIKLDETFGAIMKYKWLVEATCTLEKIRKGKRRVEKGKRREGMGRATKQSDTFLKEPTAPFYFDGVNGSSICILRKAIPEKDLFIVKGMLLLLRFLWKAQCQHHQELLKCSPDAMKANLLYPDYVYSTGKCRRIAYRRYQNHSSQHREGCTRYNILETIKIGKG